MITIDLDLADLRPGDIVLDAGCGTGRHLVAARCLRGVRVVGIDRGEADLRKAAEAMFLLDAPDDPGWLVAKADITDLPFGDAVFDAVLCAEVLEHIPECRAAVRELVRVLKPGRSLIVSVPRYFPEKICWTLSRGYHAAPGGHVRIFRRRELRELLEGEGVRCLSVRYRHALHSPYWWLKCLIGHDNERSCLVNAYRRLLEWEIMKHPPFMQRIEALLSPWLGKSLVFYLEKG